MRQDTRARGGSVGESMRLAAVDGLELMDTPPEERFDRITRLAEAWFRVPVAEINILDEHRQFTKSPQRDGRSPSTARSSTFCDITVQQPGILVVPDATRDPRFACRESVTGERRIRFYAGRPLLSGSQPVGVLCLVDTVPRAFSSDDRAVLDRIGGWVEAELRTRMRRRRTSRARADRILHGV
jgi:sigma-B regulation protein RsbU (phosphoserine phosphatase)